LDGRSYESHEYLLNPLQLPIKGILIIRFLLTFSILIFSYQSNFAQSIKLQFDRPTISQIRALEKEPGGKFFSPSVLILDSSNIPIPFPPSLKYERLSGAFKTVITYRISQDSLVENIHYTTMYTRKDSTFINTLFDSDTNTINQNAGNSEKQTHSNVTQDKRMNYWDKTGLHIRQAISLSNEIDMILYQIIIYWDDVK